VTSAEALFREGRRLLEAHDYDRACPKLAESYRLDPATGALLALAVCHEGAGKLASAWSAYAEVAARSRVEGRGDREKAAREKVAALEPKLSTLTISVARGADVPGLRVLRDGEEVGRATWGLAVPLDAGEHTIDASAAGRRDWHLKLTIGTKAERKSVEVPILDSVTPVAVAEPRVVDLPRPIQQANNDGLKSEAPADVRSGAGARDGHHRFTGVETTGLVIGGAAVLVLGAAGVFTLQALSKKHAYEQQGDACRSTCADLRAANKDGNIATVLAIGGAALAIAGAMTYLLGGGPRDDDSGDRRRSAGLRIAPSFDIASGAGSWRLAVDGRF
jgi:hypothetical protein